jgi:peptidoglycan/xylan/chitin deacetylase (PgdA/CDA1 family)
VRQALGSCRWPGSGPFRLLVSALALAVASAVALVPLGRVPAQAAAHSPGRPASPARAAAAQPGSYRAAAAPARAHAVPAHAARGHAARGHAARGHAAAGGRPTVVSLTFDDGDVDQLAAARILRRDHLAGTFYIITGAIGTPGYLTGADLRQVAAAGNEIGAHTVSHLRLTALSTAEARRQVCQSRAILTRWGYRVTSFAYPGGAADPRVEAIVRGCGFDSARGTVGLRSPGCPGCTAAESIPPANPMSVRTAGEVDGTWTLAEMKSLVTGVERAGGGWLPLVFHHLCGTPQCGDLAVRTPVLSAFARWLAQRQRRGLEVRTVSQVAGSRLRPTPRVAPAGPHGVVNASLAHTAPASAVSPSLELPTPPGSVPQCWMQGGYGHNTATWRRVHGGHAGQWAERLTITSYHSGDAMLLPQFDLGQCSLPVRPGRSYTLGTWYRASTRAQYSVYYRTWTGRWVYWTSSPFFAPGQGWAHASWATPPVPAGASGLSFGLALAATGSLTTDSYSFAATPPSLARAIADWVVLAALAAGLLALAVRMARRRRRARDLARRPAQPATAGDGPPMSSSRR